MEDYSYQHAQRRSMSMYETPVYKRASLPSLASIDSTKSVHHPMENASSAPIPIPSLRPASTPSALPSLASYSPGYTNSYTSTASSSFSESVALPKLRSMSLGEYIPQRREPTTPPSMHSSSYQGPHEMHRYMHQRQMEPDVMRFNQIKTEMHPSNGFRPTPTTAFGSFENSADVKFMPRPDIPLSRSWNPSSYMTQNPVQQRSVPTFSFSPQTSASWSPASTMLQNTVPQSASSDDDEQPDEESDPMNRGSGRVCRTKSCKNVARSKGLCRSHGGGKRCTEPGCTKSAQANKKCIAHGGGTPCSFENCDKTAQSRGLCKAHGGGARCKFPSCPKSSQSRGFCRGHGGGVRCKADGCEKWVQRNGFCIKHGREQN
ncbi:hypothetical protein SDRG_11171 [Saprolegnia diclina VS20]|uniref:WRKY19-like zinc finger domain-containing protein n=1 Tax=Saprolegnia diclina (strain VS20) TaxID=1156394 RepID=T0QCG5_SAPDV|nr:hypothetical protein SDRG_11171 [Saprolegnia diclina VS20]EQC31250.1 hypothetical protein SDRG_11171 [Saprolegnia diclina VS20]|eukprot:XP_008615423.1 hypothetical protein SDRG_11171 [Saprolegnia diclina VS20]